MIIKLIAEEDRPAAECAGSEVKCELKRSNDRGNIFNE